MSARDDDVQGYALGAVSGLVALVVAGVVALAVFKTLHGTEGPPAPHRVYFPADADTLSADAGEVLSRVAEAARDDARVMVVITGVREAQAGSALAQRRALRVRHALEADGVPPAQLLLAQPVPARGSAKEARRVDIRLE